MPCFHTIFIDIMLSCLSTLLRTFAQIQKKSLILPHFGLKARYSVTYITHLRRRSPQINRQLPKRVVIVMTYL